MDTNITRWLEGIPTDVLPVIADRLETTVDEIKADEGLAGIAAGEWILLDAERNGRVNTDPAYEDWIASQHMNPDGS